MSEIEQAISGLLESDVDDAFLIISISGSADFVQLSAYQGTAQLDFPQITERQIHLRERIESVMSDLGLTLVINTGSDGTEFLDYDLSGDTNDIAKTVQTVLERLFGLTADTELEFESNGFSLNSD